MINKNSFILGSVFVAIMLAVGTCGGWLAHKELQPCPINTTDTVTLYDTTTYTVHDSVPFLVRDTVWVPGDSVPYPRDIDTAAILKDYFSVYDYPWVKQDSNLSWKLVTRVTKNRPISYNFSYNILRPQQIINNNIDNSVSYTKYLYGGLNVPLSATGYNEFAVEGFFAFPKGYIGAAYQPYTKVFGVKAGIKILKFKSTK